MPPINALDNIKKHAQRTFYDATLKNMQTQLLDEATAADRARLRSCAGKYAGAWLNCIPSIALFRMSPVDFRICLRLRLGMEQLSIRTDVKCRCGVRPDAFGLHYLTCSAGKHPPCPPATSCASARTMKWRAQPGATRKSLA